MKIRLPVISLAFMAVVVACNRPSPVSKGANAVADVPGAASHGAPTPAGGPPQNNDAATAPAPPGSTTVEIPPALQGRWGLTPQDCTSALGEAKGLLVINAGEMRFYESRAVPTSDAQTGDGSINGDFRFAGEGQTWSKFESLQRSGDKLTRTEDNPAASYTYAKC